MCKPRNRGGLIAIATLALVLLASGIDSQAEMADGDNPLVDRWEFDLGSFFLGSNTDMTLYSTVLEQGTSINLEDDLGFDSSGTSFHISGAYRLGRRHQFSLGYFSMPRDTSEQINTELEWGDETFPIEATVIGYFDLTFLEFGYDYWLVTKDRTALSLGLSLSYIGLKTGLGIEGVEVGRVGADLKTDVPVPTLAVEWRQHLFHELILDAGLGYMTLSPLQDYKGNVWRSFIALEHRTWKYMGFGLKYSYDKYDIKKEEGGLLDWEIGFDLSGFEAYLHFMF